MTRSLQTIDAELDWAKEMLIRVSVEPLSPLVDEARAYTASKVGKGMHAFLSHLSTTFELPVDLPHRIVTILELTSQSIRTFRLDQLLADCQSFPPHSPLLSASLRSPNASIENTRLAVDARIVIAQKSPLNV